MAVAGGRRVTRTRSASTPLVVPDPGLDAEGRITAADFIPFEGCAHPGRPAPMKATIAAYDGRVPGLVEGTGGSKMVGGDATETWADRRGRGEGVVSRTGWRRGVAVEPLDLCGRLRITGCPAGWLLDAGASVFHFDVGDGHFIPEITMGPIVLESIADLVHRRGGVLDCHLMVEQPGATSSTSGQRGR